METPNNLKYVFCEDWFIYAIDRQKILYFVNTEMWYEWFDLESEDKIYEKNAVKKYMLPIAKKKWNYLHWCKAEIDGKHVRFSYIKHYWRSLNLSYHLFYRWTRYNRELRR